MKSLLFKNFSWSFVGSLIYALTQWLLIIIIMWSGSPHDAGIYSLGLALGAPLVMFINLNFRAIQSTNLSIELGFQSFKITRMMGNLFFIIVFSVIILISNYDFQVTIALLLIALNKMIESFSELYYGLFQYNERLDLISKSIMIRGVAGTFFFGLGYYILDNLSFALMIMFIIWTLNFILFDYKNGKQFLDDMPKEYNNSNIKYLIKIGLPIGLVSFIASFNVNIPRIIFEKYLTLEALGYFTTIFYLVLIIGKFMTSVSSTVLPMMARLYENNEKNPFIKIFKLIIVGLLAFSIIIIMISYFWGTELLTILYGKGYDQFRILLLLIMIYGLFNYLGFTCEIGLNAMKQYKFRLYIEILVAIVVSVSSIYFIPLYGLNGGAIALIISVLIKFILLAALFANKYLTLFMQRGVTN